MKKCDCLMGFCVFVDFYGIRICMKCVKIHDIFMRRLQYGVLKDC